MKVLDLENPWLAAKAYYVESTSSTMDLANDMIGDNVPSGTLVMAGHQSTGRGRFPERRWESTKGLNLLFTLILKVDDLKFSPSLVPLLAGFGIHSMLKDEYQILTHLKWPNDILLDSRKLAGILCESRRGYILAGIGLNCNQTDFPDLGKIVPVSLKSILHKDLELNAVLVEFLKHFYHILHEPFDCSSFNSILYKKNQKIELAVGSEIVSGVLIGIDSDGGILIGDSFSNEVRSYYSGEILYT